MTSRRGLVAIAGVAVAALVVALIVVVAGAESPPSAREALAAAKRFVEKADSVAYHGESRVAYHDPEFPEDDFSEKSTFEEAARFPDEVHSILEYDEFVTESVVIDNVSYTREAGGRRALEDEQWVRYDASDDEDFAEFVPFASTGFLVPASQLPDVIADASRPRLLSQSDDMSVVRVRIDTEEFEEIYYFNVRLDLVIEDGGRITAMRLVAGDEYETQRASVEIEQWNGSVDVAAPDEADIDPTPSIDEEDIAAFDDAPLFQPRVLPTDFALASAQLVPRGEGFDSEGEEIACDHVGLYFFNQTAFDDLDVEDLETEDFPTSSFFNLYEFPTSCAAERPDDAEDFVAGPHAGWFEDEDGFLYGQINVGDTVIEFGTDLDVETLMATLADLVPLDFTTLPIAPDGIVAGGELAGR